MSRTSINENEQAVLELIRYQGALTIAELCDFLGITATAIRQRLVPLTAANLLEKVLVRQDRGRPMHQYRLTALGLAAMGENLADLAEVLWLEVINIPDAKIRQTVIDGVLDRLADKYRDHVSGNTITERLRSIAALFRERKIPFVVETEDKQSNLRIVGCPYPKLNEHSNEICQLEQRLVARLLDAPVALNHCSCDANGGQCCTFTADVQLRLNEPPVGKNAPELASVEKQ